MAPSRTIDATINYHLDPSQGGTSFFIPGSAGNYRRKANERSVQITDIRGNESEFKLGKQGFELRRHVSTEKDFENDEVVKDVVYKETSELLKKV